MRKRIVFLREGLAPPNLFRSKFGTSLPPSKARLSARSLRSVVSGKSLPFPLSFEMNSKESSHPLKLGLTPSFAALGIRVQGEFGNRVYVNYKILLTKHNLFAIIYTVRRNGIPFRKTNISKQKHKKKGGMTHNVTSTQKGLGVRIRSDDQPGNTCGRRTVA